MTNRQIERAAIAYVVEQEAEKAGSLGTPAASPCEVSLGGRALTAREVQAGFMSKSIFIQCPNCGVTEKVTTKSAHRDFATNHESLHGLAGLVFKSSGVDDDLPE